MGVIRRHFLACDDIAGGSELSAAVTFFREIHRPFGGSLMSGGGIIILRVIRRHFLTAAMDPPVGLST